MTGVWTRLGRAGVLALPLLFLGVFFYVPLGGLILRGIGSPEGLTRVWELVSDPYIQRVARFTVVQALLSSLASLAIGLPLAYVLATYRFPGQRLVRSLTIVPFTLPPITVALGFVLVFGNSGVVNESLMAILNLERPPLKVLYSLTGIVMAHAFYNAPIVTRFTAAAWERLSPSYEESARALGASPRRAFFNITLPMLAPSIVSGATLAFIYSFLSFPIVLALGGARFSTLEVEIYRQAIVGINYGEAATLATLVLVIALAFTVGYLGLERRFSSQVRLEAPRTRRPLFAGGWTALRRVGLYGFLALTVLLFVGPMLAVLIDSVRKPWQNTVVFSLEGYREVFARGFSSLIGASPLQSVINSFSFAGATMGIAVLCGTLLAMTLARRRLRGRRSLEVLAMAPLAISSVALGLALLRVFNRPPLDISGTWIAIVVAHVALAIPFVIRVVRPALERLEGNLTDAARSLGASPWRATWDVRLPLIQGSLLTGAAFAFAISIAETSATLMLAQPGLLTMPVAVYHLLAARQFGAASAMSVIMMAVLALAFVLIDRFGERTFRTGI